jgi:hypothetical protein
MVRTEQWSDALKRDTIASVKGRDPNRNLLRGRNICVVKKDLAGRKGLRL